MKAILLITPKDPFEPFKYQCSDGHPMEAVFFNSGNMVFCHALRKLTLARDVTIECRSFDWLCEHVDEANERYERCLMSPANIFGVIFAPYVAKMTQVAQQLKIPLVLVGVGAQCSLDEDVAERKRIAAIAAPLVKSILDKGGALGLRGEYTADLLKWAGFSEEDFALTGCPSLFMNGPEICIEKPELSHEQLNPIFNGTQFWLDAGFREKFNQYPRSLFVCQDRLFQMLYAGESLSLHRLDDLFGGCFSGLLKESRVNLYGTYLEWEQGIKNRDYNFSFGNRVHGNIASLLSGIPAYINAIDSRCCELAEYFHIPYSVNLSADSNLYELYQEADYSRLNAALPAKFSQMKSFLNQQGIPCWEDASYIQREMDRLNRADFAVVAPTTAHDCFNRYENSLFYAMLIKVLLLVKPLAKRLRR